MLPMAVPGSLNSSGRLLTSLKAMITAPMISADTRARVGTANERSSEDPTPVAESITDGSSGGGASGSVVGGAWVIGPIPAWQARCR